MALDMIGKTKVTTNINVTNIDFFIAYPPFATASLIKDLSGKPV